MRRRTSIGATSVERIANDVVMLTAQSMVKPGQDSAYVFDRCRITADPGVGELWLGRAWRPYATVIFIRTRIDAPLQPAGWRERTPGATDTFKTATYREFRSTGQGARRLDARAARRRQLRNRKRRTQWSWHKFLSRRPTAGAPELRLLVPWHHLSPAGRGSF